MEDDFTEDGPASWACLPTFDYDESDTAEFGEECLEYLKSMDEDIDLREPINPSKKTYLKKKTPPSSESYDLELGVLLARSRTLSSVETERVQYLMKEKLLTSNKNETIQDTRYGLLWYLNAKLKKRKTTVEKVSKWGENWKNKRKKNADWSLIYFEVIDGILRAYDTKLETESLFEANLKEYTIETGISTKGKKDCFILRHTSGTLNESPLEVCLGCGNMKERMGWIKMLVHSCEASLSPQQTDVLEDAGVFNWMFSGPTEGESKRRQSKLQSSTSKIAKRGSTIMNFLMPGLSESPSTSTPTSTSTLNPPPTSTSPATSTSNIDSSNEIEDVSLRNTAMNKVRSWSLAGYLDPDETDMIKNEILAGNDTLATSVMEGDLDSVQQSAQEAFEIEVKMSQLVGESRQIQSVRLSVAQTHETKPRSATLRLSVAPTPIKPEDEAVVNQESETSIKEEDDEINTKEENVTIISKKPIKKVSFDQVTIKFYGYTLGNSIPSSGGPALGLNWDIQGMVEYSIEEMEELRGGNIPEDDEELENEEWNDNWRMPREYFHEEGLMSKEKRSELLLEAGHRRCSIDVNAHIATLIKARRTKHSRSKVSKFVAEGSGNLEAMYDLDRQIDAVKLLGEWVHRKKKQIRLNNAQLEGECVMRKEYK